MKSKPTRLFFNQQLVVVVLRKLNNINYLIISPTLGKKLCLSIVLLFAFPTTLVKAQQRDYQWRGDLAVPHAQITPDGSLPTSVEQQGENELNINGGEREGNNLFHSFEEFSVPEGIEAVFENAPDIENIFTRITGDTASTINGILTTQGEANFFLVNPNGIVFGENAQLDLGGSFVATTADSVQFEDGTELAASDGPEKPILTVSVPIGLDFSGDSGTIQVNGTGNQINSESPVASLKFDQRPKGLSVPSGQTLALVGNGLDFNGGVITTDGGQIYLTSIDSTPVDINQTESGLTVVGDALTRYGDINLHQQSLIDSSGDQAGIISLTGRNINLLDASFILAQNQGNSLGGSLNVNAAETLTLSGRVSDVRSNIRSETFAAGEGANIDISANHLSLKDGARIRSNSFSDALGGKIDINISDSIQLSTSSIIATTFAEGNAGNINLSAEKLRLNAAGLTSSTNGAGNGGTLHVNADLIEIVGTSSTDRASIATTSFSHGDAGNLTLNTTKLRVIDGASLSSSSFGSGNAGEMTVNASESVEVKGSNNNSRMSNNPQSTIRSAVQSVPPPARKALSLPDVPSGEGGNLTINTPWLNITQEGVVSVENQGVGNGGSLSLNAEQLNLSEGGKITAATESGIGGEIYLNTENLQIDESSEVTATAKNDGDGGNITINTSSLIAKKNSEITANAFQGRGGNINIEAQGLFLFDSPDQIFSASSQLGIDGTIQINTPDLDLQRELEQSELELLLTTEAALANSCLARSNRQGSFTVGSTGGFPQNPNSNYSDANFSLTGVGSLPTTIKQPSKIPENYQQPNPSTGRLQMPNQVPPVSRSMLPAEKMVETQDGRIFLVAAPQKAESLFCQSVEEKEQ